jgi:cytochrome c
MPGSPGRRKRDNLFEFAAGIRFSAARRGGLALPLLRGGKSQRTTMPSFEWNKIIASVLTAGIVAMVSGILASHIIAPQRLEKPAYLPPGAAGGGKPAAAAAAAAPKGPPPIGPYLAKADPKKGEQIAKVCEACHDFAKGGPNKIGPDLWGVAEEKIAAVPHYEFSSALSKHKNEKWNPKELNVWLHNPQDFASGTKMSFPGISDPQQRADVIAYLETLTPGGAAHEKEVAEKAAAAAKEQKKPAAAKPKAAAAPAAGQQIGPALAKADPKKGKQIAAVCQACHTFGKGQPNGVGPNLDGVFGGPIAADRGGYQFSEALSKHKSQKWTPTNLDAWLANPQKFADGTKMTFPGLPSLKERADVIAYLKSLK